MVPTALVKSSVDSIVVAAVALRLPNFEATREHPSFCYQYTLPIWHNPLAILEITSLIEVSRFDNSEDVITDLVEVIAFGIEFPSSAH